MANEITLTVRARCVNGLAILDWNPGAWLATQTTKGVVTIWQDVGTSAETVSFGDAAPGFVMLRNHDTTNYVEFGMSDGGTQKIVGKLRSSGGLALFELAASTTLMLKANTAACKVEIAGFTL